MGKSKLWKNFLTEYSFLIEKSGLPLDYFETESLWVDFLMHGYIDHHEDPNQFNVDQMNEIEYSNFKQLIEMYFQSGFEFFSPIALVNSEEVRYLENIFAKN